MLYKELEKKSQSKLENDFCFLSGVPTLPVSNGTTHNTTCIIGICTHGNAQIKVQAQEYTIAPHNVFILMPGVSIPSINVSSNFNASYFALSQSFFHDVIKTIKSLSPMFFTYMRSHFLYPLPQQGAKYFTDYCHLLTSSTQMPQTISREMIISLIRILFLDLYNDFKYATTHRDSLPGRDRKEELTHRFYALMTANYREYKEINYYAEKLNVSSKYLTEVIKKTSGKSPKEWIVEYSLLEIKELLKSTSASIQEIALCTKFATQSSLGRFFKRYTHMSPSEYRKSMLH